MTQDLKLSTAAAAYEQQVADQSGTPKKSGCGCFVAGCLGLFLLIMVPVVGSFVYIASLDGSDAGKWIAQLATHEEFRKEFRNGINNSKDLTSDQRTMVLGMYEKFLANYDAMSSDEKQSLHRNIYDLTVKMITEGEQLKDAATPPQEFMEILRLLKMENELSLLKSNLSSSTTTPITTPTTVTTTTTNDPYSFDTGSNQNTTTPTSTTTTTTPTQPTGTGYKTEYDF